MAWSPAVPRGGHGSRGREVCVPTVRVTAAVPHRFADQRGARAAFTVSSLAACLLYLLLVASCSPALPRVALLFASRLPAAFMHTMPGGTRQGASRPAEGRGWGCGLPR